MRDKWVRTVIGTCLVLVCVCPGARALGALAFRNPEERALGIGGAPWVFHSSPRRGWLAELGLRHPFGIDGLDVTQARIGAVAGSWGWLGSGALVTAPVGSEIFVSLQACCRSPRWMLSLTADYQAAILDGTERADLATLTVSVQGLVRELLLGYTAGGYRVLGEPLPGIETTAYIVAFAGSVLTGTATLRLGRNGDLDTGIGCKLRLGSVAYAAFGYREETGILNGALGVGARSFGVAVGVAVHPILGMSQSVSLSWRR